MVDCTCSMNHSIGGEFFFFFCKLHSLANAGADFFVFFSHHRFEMVIILHKMIMTGAMCMVAPGSSIQLLVAVLIQMFYMLLVLKVAPYDAASEDYTQFIASLCLTMTMIGGLIMIMDDASNQTYETNFLGVVLIAQNVFVEILEI